MTSQWPDNCDAVTWIMISNSLDIDFIYGDIHGRSCKKAIYSKHHHCPYGYSMTVYRSYQNKVARSGPFYLYRLTFANLMHSFDDSIRVDFNSLCFGKVSILLKLIFIQSHTSMINCFYISIFKIISYATCWIILDTRTDGSFTYSIVNYITVFAPTIDTNGYLVSSVANHIRSFLSGHQTKNIKIQNLLTKK